MADPQRYKSIVGGRQSSDGRAFDSNQPFTTLLHQFGFKIVLDFLDLFFASLIALFARSSIVLHRSPYAISSCP